MYNFIIQLLGIEDNNITIDDYFKERMENLLFIFHIKRLTKYVLNVVQCLVTHMTFVLGALFIPDLLINLAILSTIDADTNVKIVIRFLMKLITFLLVIIVFRILL